MYKTAILYKKYSADFRQPNSLRSQDHLFKYHVLLDRNREHRRKAVCLQVLIQEVDSKVHTFLVWQEHPRARNLKKKRRAISICFCATGPCISSTPTASEMTPSLHPSPVPPSLSILRALPLAG